MEEARNLYTTDGGGVSELQHEKTLAEFVSVNLA